MSEVVVNSFEGHAGRAGQVGGSLPAYHGTRQKSLELKDLSPYPHSEYTGVRGVSFTTDKNFATTRAGYGGKVIAADLSGLTFHKLSPLEILTRSKPKTLSGIDGFDFSNSEEAVKIWNEYHNNPNEAFQKYGHRPPVGGFRLPPVERELLVFKSAIPKLHAAPILNSFEGHAGRQGMVGGSAPRSDGFRSDNYWRGGDVKITDHRPAIYLTKNEDVAHWFAQSSNMSAHASPYLIKTSKTATMDDLNRLCKEAQHPALEVAEQKYREQVSKIPANLFGSDYTDKQREIKDAVGLTKLNQDHWPRQQSVSYLTPFEVGVLKKHGFDSIEGKMDSSYGNMHHEIAVFDESQIKPSMLTNSFSDHEGRPGQRGGSSKRGVHPVKNVSVSYPRTVGIGMEVAPNPDHADRVSRWGKLSSQDQFKASKELSEKHVQAILRDMKLDGEINHTSGGFEGGFNPSFEVRLAAGTPYEKAREAGIAIGSVLGQKAVIPFDESNGSHENSHHFTNLNVKKDLSSDEQKALYDHVRSKVPEASGMVYRKGQMSFGNFSNLSNEDFHKKVSDAAAEHSSKAGYEIEPEAKKIRSEELSDLDSKLHTDTMYGDHNNTSRHDTFKKDFDQSFSKLGETPPQAAPTVAELHPANPVIAQKLDKITGGKFSALPDEFFRQKKPDAQQIEIQNGIAHDYDKLKADNLSDPRVQRAYKELAEEVREQYRAIGDGMKFEAFSGKGEPYKNSSEMRADIKDNNHLFFLATHEGTFGSGETLNKNNPMLQDSGVRDVNGTPMLMNDVFRAVHDYIAHGSHGSDFGGSGEEAAWRTHLATLKSPWAKWALTSETRGQNSWVNYQDKYLKDGLPIQKGQAGFVPAQDRPFAEQKNDLLPVSRMLTGHPEVDKNVLSDVEFLRFAGDRDDTGGGKSIPKHGSNWKLSGNDLEKSGKIQNSFAGHAGRKGQRGGSVPMLSLVHYSHSKHDEIDPKFFGGGIASHERKRQQNYPDVFQKRTYWGTAGYEPEGGLGKVVSRISVPKNSIYDYDSDPKGFYNRAFDLNKKTRRYAMFEESAHNTVAEKLIKEAGYLGYRSKAHQIAALFHKVPSSGSVKWSKHLKNSFEGHAGRKGMVGGSLPRGDSSPNEYTLGDAKFGDGLKQFSTRSFDFKGHVLDYFPIPKNIPISEYSLIHDSKRLLFMQSKDGQERMIADLDGRRFYTLKKGNTPTPEEIGAGGVTADGWKTMRAGDWNPSQNEAKVLSEKEVGSLAWMRKLKLTYSNGSAFDSDLNIGHIYSGELNQKEVDITNPDNVPAGIDGVFRYAGKMEAKALAAPVNLPLPQIVEKLAGFSDTVDRSAEYVEKRTEHIAEFCEKIKGMKVSDSLMYLDKAEKRIDGAREKDYAEAVKIADTLASPEAASIHWKNYFSNQLKTAKTDAVYAVRKVIERNFVKSLIPNYKPENPRNAWDTEKALTIAANAAFGTNDPNHYKSVNAFSWFNDHVNPASIADMQKSPTQVRWSETAPTGGVTSFHRSHYNPKTHEITMMPDADDATVVHELGHHLAIITHADEYAKDFIAARGLSEQVKLKRLSGDNSYLDTEYAHPDRFVNPYVGKNYGAGHPSTEVVSMGLEHMMRDPIWFYQHDREHFLFTKYVMEGGLRHWHS